MNRFNDISRKFPAETAAVGRLLAGYADLEISLMNCVHMGRGGDLDTVLRLMYGERGETRRINTALVLGKAAYTTLGLSPKFETAISDMRFCLRIRNSYAHALWHDANTGYLAFVNLEELVTAPTTITDLLGLTIRFLDIDILTNQEKYLDYVDHSISFLNYEGRRLRRDLTTNPVAAPAVLARPPLHRP